MIKQISVFVENKEGRLAEITGIIAKENIDIRALSIADTTNFGILRLIVNKPDECFAALKAADMTVSITNVIAVSIADRAGAFADILAILAKENIDVGYVYAFVGNTDFASVILRVEDNERAAQVLTNAGITLLDGEDIYGA